MTARDPTPGAALPPAAALSAAAAADAAAMASGATTSPAAALLCKCSHRIANGHTHVRYLLVGHFCKARTEHSAQEAHHDSLKHG